MVFQPFFKEIKSRNAMKRKTQQHVEICDLKNIVFRRFFKNVLLITFALIFPVVIARGQDIASKISGLNVRTCACVGHESNHVGGTIFNKTEETVYGNYEIMIYDDSQNPILVKTEPFIAYPRQSKKFNLKLNSYKCNGTHGYVFRLVTG
jgi:hypothetical protein